MWKQINPGPHQQELHSQAMFSLATWRKHDLQWINMAVRPETRLSLRAVPSGVTWGCNTSLMSGTSLLLTVQQTPPQSCTHTHVSEQRGNIHPYTHVCVVHVLSDCPRKITPRYTFHTPQNFCDLVRKTLKTFHKLTLQRSTWDLGHYFLRCGNGIVRQCRAVEFFSLMGIQEVLIHFL